MGVALQCSMITFTNTIKIMATARREILGTSISTKKKIIYFLDIGETDLLI